MGEHGTVIFAVAGGFLVLAVVAALVWWSLADRVFPGADRATGQRVDVMRLRGRKGGVDRGSGAEVTPTVVAASGKGSKERIEAADGPDGSADGGTGGGAGDGGGGGGGGD